jgi:hypothetical protein
MVLYGCETWSLTLRGEQRLRVFENGVLRRIFGPKRDEVTGEWKKLRNEELNDLYSSPRIIRTVKSRMMLWTRHVARIGEKRNAYRLMVTNSVALVSERAIPTERPPLVGEVSANVCR